MIETFKIMIEIKPIFYPMQPLCEHCEVSVFLTELPFSVLKRISFDFCHESAAIFSHYWAIDSSNSALPNVNDSVSQLWMGIQ